MVKITHKDDIHKLVSEETDDLVGHPGWLKHYPRALTTVMKNLSPGDIRSAENTAKHWTEDGAPRDEQRK